MKTSIIIPTKNRKESLLRTLASLQEQTLQEFEILVVDNAGGPEVKRAIDEFNGQARIEVRYLEHISGGISGARNAGIRKVVGDLIAFTDDDLTFDPNWLAEHVEKFERYPEMVAAGGHVKPIWEKEPPAWLLEFMGKSRTFPVLALIELHDEFTICTDNIFFGCNMVIRRETLCRHDGFRPSYINGRTVGSSEWGIVLRLQKAGCLIGYNPEAVVYHHIPASRMTIDYIRRWAWHAGGGEMYERWLNRRRTALSILREVIRLVMKYGLTWLRAMLHRHHRDRQSVETQFRASLGMCELSYVWWMLSDREIKLALNTEGRPS